MSTIDEGELDRLEMAYRDRLPWRDGFIISIELSNAIPKLIAAARALSAEKAAREEAERERDLAREDARLRLAQKPFDETYEAIEPIVRCLLKAPINDVEFAVETAANEIAEAVTRNTFNPQWAALEARATTAEAETARLRERVKEMEAALAFGIGCALNELADRGLPLEWSPRSGIGRMTAALGWTGDCREVVEAIRSRENSNE